MILSLCGANRGMVMQDDVDDDAFPRARHRGGVAQDDVIVHDSRQVSREHKVGNRLSTDGQFRLAGERKGPEVLRGKALQFIRHRRQVLLRQAAAQPVHKRVPRRVLRLEGFQQKIFDLEHSIGPAHDFLEDGAHEQVLLPGVAHVENVVEEQILPVAGRDQLHFVPGRVHDHLLQQVGLGGDAVGGRVLDGGTGRRVNRGHNGKPLSEWTRGAS